MIAANWQSFRPCERLRRQEVQPDGARALQRAVALWAPGPNPWLAVGSGPVVSSAWEQVEGGNFRVIRRKLVILFDGFGLPLFWLNLLPGPLLAFRCRLLWSRRKVAGGCRRGDRQRGNLDEGNRSTGVKISNLGMPANSHDRGEMRGKDQSPTRDQTRKIRVCGCLRLRKIGHRAGSADSRATNAIFR